VRDPDFVDTFTADDKGRINLGQDYANAEVKAAIGVLQKPDEEDH